MDSDAANHASQFAGWFIEQWEFVASVWSVDGKTWYSYTPIEEKANKWLPPLLFRGKVVGGID